MKKTVAFCTLGCKVNQYETDAMRGSFEAEGYEVKEFSQEASVYVINTCTVTNMADRKSRQMMHRAKKKNPDGIIVAVGCYVQAAKEQLEEDTLIDLVIGNNMKSQVVQIVEQYIQDNRHTEDRDAYVADIAHSHEYETMHIETVSEHTRAYIKIQDGCNQFCSYCIIPYARGRVRSRKMEDILQELRELKAQGYREVTLLGQNVNAYGKDLGIAGGFAALLRESAKTGIDRIRFTTSHPWDFSDEMIEAIASCDNIMPFIHLPVQSGDSDVLRRMGRRYSIEQYRALFDRIKAAIPECGISTDIIVGFPNESDEQFQHTLDIVDYCRFDNAYTFIYSPREGTPAARMEDSVPLEVKQQRLAQLNARWNAHALEKNKAYVGRRVKVLVDGPSKKDEHIYSGYTETNKLVNFTAENAQAGDIVEVIITEARTWSLKGEEARS